MIVAVAFETKVSVPIAVLPMNKVQDNVEAALVAVKLKSGVSSEVFTPLAGLFSVTTGVAVSIFMVLLVEAPLLPAESVQLTYHEWLPSATLALAVITVTVSFSVDAFVP
jgi:hypothetical protein